MIDSSYRHSYEHWFVSSEAGQSIGIPLKKKEDVLLTDLGIKEVSGAIYTNMYNCKIGGSVGILRKKSAFDFGLGVKREKRVLNVLLIFWVANKAPSNVR